MSTNPITPRDQTGGAWQPTVDTSAKDAGDEKSAAQKYDSIYGGTYTTSTSSPSDSSSSPGSGGTAWPLSMAYTTAPDLIPVPESPGSGSGSTVPLADQFNVDLGAVRSTEQTFLTATSDILNAYQTLTSAVQNAIHSDSIFGQLDGDSAVRDNLDPEGKSFAASVDPQMQQLLASVSDIVESMGQFNALLNNAAQMYTDTDASAAFPAPGNV